jgi:hypothetical protein
MAYSLEAKEPLHDDNVIDALAGDHLAAQREPLRASLDEIASAVTTALDDPVHPIAVFLTVPSSGEALLTFATPIDPTDEDWSRVSQVICDIVGNRIGVEGLYGRPVLWAASVPRWAADVPVALGDPARPKV